MTGNPLLSERDTTYLLYDVHDAVSLTQLPHFADHDRETFDQFLGAVRRFSRERLWPSYSIMDSAPPTFRDDPTTGRRNVVVHPLMHDLYPRLARLGVIAASRPFGVGGGQLPVTVSTLALTWLMAGNLSAAGYAFLTAGAAHLIEAFGDEWLKSTFMAPMYDGRFTGTMALTEPQAGSSLADITTVATPLKDGRYYVRGSKIFISGGEQDFSDNIVHLTLARIEGAPAGTRGVSLFAVPRKRPEGDTWVDNDVAASQVIHKIGWKGLPSVVLDYGTNGDCIGWLVGTAGSGLRHMFQMMNEARILVGANGIATASVGYQESLQYAKDRPQGRHVGQSASSSPQVPIAEHADVRRMLLRQKAIVIGGLSLVLETARFQDLSEHAKAEEERREAGLLADLMTPLAKTFPAEWGYDANTLALQIHGGYGYSSEYVVEALLRDQKLNSIHEGTTGIQGLDLLGRKLLKDRGQGLGVWVRRVDKVVAAAKATRNLHLQQAAEVLGRSLGDVRSVLMALGARGEVSAMLRHSTDMLLAMCAIAVGWQWLKVAVAAEGDLAGTPTDAERRHREGLLYACRYWFADEMPMARLRLTRVRVGDSSHVDCPIESL